MEGGDGKERKGETRRFNIRQWVGWMKTAALLIMEVTKSEVGELDASEY